MNCSVKDLSLSMSPTLIRMGSPFSDVFLLLFVELVSVDILYIFFDRASLHLKEKSVAGSFNKLGRHL